MDKSVKQRGINGISIFILCVATVAIFIFSYIVFFEVDFHNRNGYYMSVSGSTIKFVNQWLSEGALNLRFTCYEYFDSIEFDTYKDRLPYISYPTGSTALIWLLAKVTGRVHIGVSFLKHVQAGFFCIETMVFALFSYLLLSRYNVKGEIDKVTCSLLIATMWMLMPGNAWFLANVLFADQVVILYIMLFTVLEYINEISENRKINVCVLVLKVNIIYWGIITDYYFWIFIFLIFLLKEIRCYIIQKNIKKLFLTGIEYVVPVILGGGDFYLASDGYRWLA